jgi:hypothetical protein
MADWLIASTYLLPLLLLIILFGWSIRGVLRKNKEQSIFDRYFLGLVMSCLCTGALVAFLRAISLASSFEYPGEAWANVLLPFVIMMTPVIGLVFRHYRLRRVFAFLWVVPTIILVCLAYSNWSPTTYAMRECPSVAKILIDADIAVNKRDYMGQTPLGIAIRKGDAASVRVLIEKGADVNLEIIVRQPRTVARYTPLKWAVIYNGPNDTILDLLRQAGAK